jgi:hypothetical protein
VQLVGALEPVPDARAAWHDAETVTLLEPDPRLPFGSIPLVEPGTPVEIKAAQVTHANGQRGRFYFRRGQHQQLLDAAGMYAFVVYAPRPGHPHLARLLVPASIVDHLLSSWIDVEGRLSHAKLTWSRVLRPGDVPEGRQ